jgi:small-conductance mechanosensitive channel
LGILIFGGLLASVLSRLLGRISKWHKKVDQSAAALVQKTTFFVLILLVLVLVIQVAKVPLAFLTLILTAVVIGASIGAKNTIYDYLSGVILVLERPVRVSDCVEVDKEQGIVTEISGRCTIIRRFDGIDVLVPNSKLLENSVMNWTLRDLKLRGDIKVSVSYSSPARQVAEILRQAIEENDEVLETPSAGVFLWEFGESSLDFWAWFWTDVKSPLDIWRIQSAIRYRILELFNEHGITIAFPQRDVHLDSSSPLRIQDAQAEKIDRETQRSRQQAVTSTDPTDDRHDEKQKEANAQTEDELKEDHLGPHV